MIIDVNLIKRQGKSQDSFVLEYLPTRNLLDLPEAFIDGAVRAEVTVSLEDRKAFVEGVIRYTVKGECSRCLEEATADVEEEIYQEFSQDMGAEFPIKSGKIDLTEIVEEAIMSSCPLVIYCVEDCKGICPGCGVNLNRQNCKCKN